MVFILQSRLLKHNWLVVAGSALVPEELAFSEVCYPYKPRGVSICWTSFLSDIVWDCAELS